MTNPQPQPSVLSESEVEEILERALREQLAEAREYGNKLARNYSSLEDWVLRIRIKLGLQAKDADIEGAIEALQSRLAQVEKERDDLRLRLDAALKLQLVISGKEPK